jgi:hypothetical protein
VNAPDDRTPDEVNFAAQVAGRKHHDDWDAYMVESLRALGREIGQEREYERRAQQYLARNGYDRDDGDEW